MFAGVFNTQEQNLTGPNGTFLSVLKSTPTIKPFKKLGLYLSGSFLVLIVEKLLKTSGLAQKIVDLYDPIFCVNRL